MADVVFTVTAIKASTNAVIKTAQLGEAGITQGMVLYQKAADNKWYKADCTVLASAVAGGFALGAGGTDQYISILTAGNMTCDNLSISAAAAAGTYVLSEAGLIAPSGDLAADDYLTTVGVATSATNLLVNFTVSNTKIVA